MDKDLIEAVKKEIGTIEGALRKYFDDDVAKRFAESNKAIEENRAALAKLQAGGENPTAEKVVELEKKLIGAETSLREIVEKLAALPIVSSGGTGNTPEDDAKRFAGYFIKDQKELRSRIYGLHNDQASVRAIDSSLFATGGKLSPDTADRFIDFATDKQILLSRITTRRMMSNEGKTDELTLTARKLRRAVEGVAPQVANAIGTRRRSLSTAETIWAEDITLTFLEDNIERAGAEAHIARKLAQGFGNDLNDLAWNGNDGGASAGADPFLSINEGFFYLFSNDADVNDVDASALSAPTNTDILGAMYRAQQFEFLARTDLNFWVPVGFAQRYADEVSRRETGLGDNVLVQGFPALRYFGIPVVPEPHIYGANADRAVLTPAENLYHGIQRAITVDSEWVPRKRVVEFTITARDDFQYATGKAVVMADNIPAANR